LRDGQSHLLGTHRVVRGSRGENRLAPTVSPKKPPIVERYADRQLDWEIAMSAANRYTKEWLGENYLPWTSGKGLREKSIFPNRFVAR